MTTALRDGQRKETHGGDVHVPVNDKLNGDVARAIRGPGAKWSLVGRQFGEWQPMERQRLPTPAQI
jgi:hypothetical protein